MHGEAEDEQDEDDEVDAPGEGQHPLGRDLNVSHLRKQRKGGRDRMWGVGCGYGCGV